MKEQTYTTKKIIAIDLLSYKDLCLQQQRKTQKMLDELPDINRENMYDFINHIQKIHKENLSSLCEHGAIDVRDKNEYLTHLSAIHNYNELEEYLNEIYQQLELIHGYRLITMKEFIGFLAFPWVLYLIYNLWIQL